MSVLRDSGCSTAVVRKDLVLDCQMTGKNQRCILIDGTVKDAPVARIWVSSPYYTGNVDALCMSEPVFDLILGNIPCVREPNQPEKDLHSILCTINFAIILYGSVNPHRILEFIF